MYLESSVGELLRHLRVGMVLETALAGQHCLDPCEHIKLEACGVQQHPLSCGHCLSKLLVHCWALELFLPVIF